MHPACSGRPASLPRDGFRPRPQTTGARIAPDDILAERRAKLERLRAEGIDPYPVGVRVTTSLARWPRAFADRLEAGEESDEHVVSVGGRLVMRRGHGKLVFLVLREARHRPAGDGAARRRWATDAMADVAELDVGDWVAAAGPSSMRTKRGELSVKAESVTLIGKSLRPLPDKWHGLRDIETRFRQREVDLTVNADVAARVHDPLAR